MRKLSKTPIAPRLSPAAAPRFRLPAAAGVHRELKAPGAAAGLTASAKASASAPERQKQEGAPYGTSP